MEVIYSAEALTYLDANLADPTLMPAINLALDDFEADPTNGYWSRRSFVVTDTENATPTTIRVNTFDVRGKTDAAWVIWMRKEDDTIFVRYIGPPLVGGR